jgi:hypothetical protein
MLVYSDTLFWFRANQSLLFLLNAACLAEKQQIPILPSLVWPDWLEPTIYRIWGEHANNYAIDEVILYNTSLITIYPTIIYKLHVFCLSISLNLHNQNEPLNYICVKVVFLK